MWKDISQAAGRGNGSDDGREETKLTWPGGIDLLRYNPNHRQNNASPFMMRERPWDSG
jgi:hypothetical protein